MMMKNKVHGAVRQGDCLSAALHAKQPKTITVEYSDLDAQQKYAINVLAVWWCLTLTSSLLTCYLPQ